MGAKESVLTDEKGLLPSVVLSGASAHDVKLLGAMLDQTVVQRLKSSAKFTQDLCLDIGYTGSKDKAKKGGYITHTRPRSEEKQELLWNPDFKARHWVVEATHSFFGHFRKLLTHSEKKAANYLDLLHLACAIIVWRKLIRARI